MNAYLKKEIRLLLPSALSAAALALALLWITDTFDGLVYFAGCIFCPTMAVMVCLSSFGTEVSTGTFSNLLSQPVSRQQIWETKIRLLALTLLGLAVLWICSALLGAVGYGNNHAFKQWQDLVSMVATFALVVFSGGLWTVLLLRQVAAAFWFTLLAPSIVLMIVAAFLSGYDENLFAGVAVTALGLYSLIGFLFARWLFFRAQDVQWSGGAIVLPELRGLARLKARADRRAWRPWAALWRKECMLHQSQLVVAFVLLLLHLGVLAARHFCDLSHSEEIKFALEAFWGLWLALPLLVGCAAVAEERKLGTHDAQLSLPMKRRTEFAVKLAAMLGLSLLFGVVMPLVLEGTRILPVFEWKIIAPEPGWENTLSTLQRNFLFALEFLQVATPLLFFIFITLVISCVAFYVSTLCRNTLQSLAPAVLGIAVAWLLMAAALLPTAYRIEWLWSGPLPYFLCGPLMALALLRRAYVNFKEPRPDLRSGGRNLLGLALALALGVLLTAATYHRFWEKLTPFDPAHGPARLKLSEPAVLDAEWAAVSVRLPDGRFWLADFQYDPETSAPLDLLLGNMKLTMNSEHRVTGSNWRMVKRAARELVGIKTDGSLWVSEKPLQATRLANGKWNVDTKGMWNLTPFGTETNWSSLCRFGMGVLLVKNDGTLWFWGLENLDVKTNWPGLRAYTPYRTGTDSNWAGVFLNNYRPGLRKTDGTIWQGDEWGTNSLPSLEIMPGFTVYSIPTLRDAEFRSTTWVRPHVGGGLQLGIHRDGSFRIWAEQRLVWDKGRYGSYRWVPSDVSIGTETNWLAVAGGGEKIVTLKNDGTLWLWKINGENADDKQKWMKDIQNASPTQLGSHTDWIAISTSWSDVVALAADGSLWYWPLSRVDEYYNQDKQSLRPLLDISRKPQRLGNVFEGGHQAP